MEESDPILNYYSKGVERDRLNQDPFLVEGIRTKELISRHLGPAPLKIADIGGGAGYYALWLAALGHQVYLIDPSPVNIGAAKEADANRKLTSIEVGDARKLRFQPDFFDVVLMMGPLYHLTERGERLNALSEGHRILKKGGTILCATISRFASMLDGFFGNLVKDPEFVEIMKGDIGTGVHRNHTNKDYFTTSYFHRTEEIVGELLVSGFTSVQWYAIEGFAWLLSNMRERLKEEAFRTLLLELLQKVEAEKSMIGVSAHLLTVGKK